MVIKEYKHKCQFLKRVPYDKFTNIEHIGKCCFSQIYKETGERITMVLFGDGNISVDNSIKGTWSSKSISITKFIKRLEKELQWYCLESPLRESSDECAIQPHHYTPQDEINKGIFSLQKTIKNRENNNNDKFKNFNGSIFGINVKFQSIGNFENNYQARKGKFAILREIMSYYSKSHRRVKSADEVYELLLQKVSCLQNLYVKSSIIHRKWSNSKKRIRPTSFFQLLKDENEENLVGPI
ncbi:hypothetical protein Glove_633g15 [Diversispora epigaea]|uniref:Uncharacterized protein n=1 Tax=Diversispora epigaea TaxID=1348612 RepID=A0A397G9R0_9GLOM|nr:hypothetical protein Glove_633g15 [Diversispora epigaea]